MPSMPSGLPRSVMTWVSQVSVSIGATLMATVIYGALPRLTIPQLEPAPELTSGGKFAARALQPDALQAFDGLDTMPLPRVSVPTAILPADFFIGSTKAAVAAPLTAAVPAAPTAAGWPILDPMRRVVGSGGPIRGVSLDPPVRTAKSLHPTLAKHAARAVLAEAAAPEPIAQVSSNEPTAATDDGLLPKVMSTARGAWSVTASASDALLAHVVPQIP